MQKFQNFYENKILNLKIRIKIESLLNQHQTYLKQIHFYENVNSNPFYNFKFKLKCFTLKKNLLLTTLSSPHIHKKSREQYKLYYYKTYYTCSILNFQDYKKFLQFKIQLYDFYLNHGLSQYIICTYFKTIHIQGYLP
jgi:hypothetical protein